MRHVVTFALQRRPLVILLFFVFIALGLWDVRVQFNFNYTYDQALQQVLNRLGQLDGLPEGVEPQISPLSPIGEIMRYRLVGAPGDSIADLKTLQDWGL